MPVKIQTTRTPEDGSLTIGLKFHFTPDSFDPVRLREFYTKIGELVKAYLPAKEQAELLAAFDKARARLTKRKKVGGTSQKRVR